jgi:hypothetical protein
MRLNPRLKWSGAPGKPETKAAWKAGVDRRIEGIQGIPGEESSAHIRKIIGR